MSDLSSLPIPITREEQYLYGIAEAIYDEKLLKYLGVTTTELTDGSTTNPITIDGENVTAKNADWAVYASKDFIFNGTIWQEVGDLSEYYTKTEMDNLLALKANTADVYSKTQADSIFVKADSISITSQPTSSEINASINTIWGS